MIPSTKNNLIKKIIMKISNEDYKIWENDIFIIECSIDVLLWNKKLINDFQENLDQILEKIREKSDSTLSNSKNLISVSFSGDKKIMELNYNFRKLNSATNVLSFPSFLRSDKTLFLGDIIFSNETICKEAKRDNKSINSHLTHLFIHGVLHLLGYDHETEEQAKKMQNLEIEILRSINIENPYD